MIQKSYQILASNPFYSYGTGSFSYGRGNNRAAEQYRRLDLTGDVPFIWNMSLESGAFAGIFFTLFILSSLIENIKKGIFYKRRDDFYFSLFFIFIVDIYFYSFSSIILPPLTVIFAFLFI